MVVIVGVHLIGQLSLDSITVTEFLAGYASTPLTWPQTSRSFFACQYWTCAVFCESNPYCEILVSTSFGFWCPIVGWRIPHR